MTPATRSRLVGVAALAGAAQLGGSLASKPDSPRFYGLTTGVAATWIATGVLAGPLPLGRDGDGRRPVLRPILLGVAAFAVFYLIALVARRIPILGKAIAGVLAYAHRGTTPMVLATTLLNGAAEEVFFRGAIYDTFAGRHPVVYSTGVYATITGVTRNPALVLASMVMGALFGWQRDTTGGLQASTLTHLTWSTLMLLLLPPLFPPGHPATAPAAPPAPAAAPAPAATGRPR